jgi:4-amino-4-deoxy-L-arabinose transferase-like glycosyltransferase
VKGLGPNGALDSSAYEAYASYIATYKRLPPTPKNYEYQAPPLFEVVGTGAEWIVKRVPSRSLGIRPGGLADVIWLALVGMGCACMTSRERRRRLAGLGVLAVTAAWSIDETLTLGRSQHWAAGRLISLAECVALLVVTGLIGRELWPRHPRRAIGVAAFALAYPVVFRMGVLFHPEMTLALLGSLALLLVIRAEKGGWPVWSGVAAGVLVGVGALTRQTAVDVAVCIVVGAVVAGRRLAVRFSLAFVAAVVLVAGGWWGYAYHRWGNPLQGNENRPGFMLVGEPTSFFVSFPIASLVEHPYRPDLANQFVPQLHADLWSDWFGALHNDWSGQSHSAKLTASTQSVLGVVPDALALAGIAAIGVPAALRVLSRRRRAADFGLGLLTLVALTALVGLFLQILRYPQMEGDQIKTSYLLFTTPCWAVLSVAAWVALSRKSRFARIALPIWAVLYAISYATATAVLFA